MIDIKRRVKEIRREILELHNLKKFKELEIKELYEQCNHEFELMYSGYEESIYVCKKCGYRDLKRKIDVSKGIL